MVQVVRYGVSQEEGAALNQQNESLVLRRWLFDAVLIAALTVVDLIVWNGAVSMRSGGALPIVVIPLVSIAVYSTLILRWRLTLPVFALQFTYSLAGLAVVGYEPFVGLLAALHAAARRCSIKVAWSALGLCVVPFAIDSWDTASATGGSKQLSFLASFALWTVVSLSVWGFGRLALNAQLSAERRAQEQADRAVLEQRLELARELHDTVSHAVSAMLLQAAGAAKLASSERAEVREALGVIEATGVTAMNELHSLLGLLRSDIEATEPHAPSNLTARLDNVRLLVASVEACGIDVETTVEGRARDLPVRTELVAYRVIQEGLTNVVRHAGRGATVALRTTWAEGRVVVLVRDRRGPSAHHGWPIQSSGLGLIGLRERVESVGGSFRCGPVSDGFEVRADLPTPHSNPAAKRSTFSSSASAHGGAT